MINMLKRLFGQSVRKTDFARLMKEGAVILDVRTSGEYKQGHIKGSLNLPLQKLSSEWAKLQKDKPIITCCASGMRSGQARSMLLANGWTDVYNGGGWSSLQNKIS